MFRFVRSAAPPANSIATAMGRAVLIVIALLIVTVGVLSTESRFPQSTHDTNLRHTSKIGRMTECDGAELAPAAIEESRPVPLVVVLPAAIHGIALLDFVLPEFTGVSPAHGLRAPPLL